MDLVSITEDTLRSMAEPMAKALATGYTVGLGLQGYSLDAPAKQLVPVVTPFLNSIPRHMAPVGSLASHWRAITSINTANANPFVAFGTAGAQIQTQEQDYTATYAALALGDTVPLDAQALARGFDNLRARSGINLVFATKIAEDKMLLGAQNFALQVPAAPTVTIATTGGSIPNATAVHFVCAVRTIEGYWFAAGTGVNSVGCGASSADGTATTGGGTTSTASASVTGISGAVAYDWYAGATTSAYYYVGTTTVPVSPTITALPSADAAVTSLPGMSTTVRAGGGTNVRTLFTDGSADANAFNGLLATLTGDYNSTGSQVTRGSGTTASGAVFSDLANATLTGSSGSITELDSVLLSLYNTSRISPTKAYMSPQQHQDISNKMVTSGGITTLLPPDDARVRASAVGGGAFQKWYINKAANGYPIELVTEPHLPPGLVIFVSEVLPYPNNEVANVFDVETQMEYTQIEYAQSRVAGTGGGPRYDPEVRVIEVFRNFFPAGCAVVQGIKNG